MLEEYSHLKRKGYSNILRISLTIMEFFFLQETHSSIKNENTWVNDFSYPMCFFHGASSSCGVVIGYLWESSFDFNQQKTDKTKRILFLFDI